MKLPLKKYINLLSKYLKTQKLNIFLSMAILICIVILQLINPQVLRYFIDTAKSGSPSKALIIVACIYIGIALIQQILNILATYIGQNVGWKATNALRLDLISHCIDLDMSFHKSHKVGELIEMVDGDVNSLFNFFSKFLFNVLNNLVLLIGILLMLLREDWRIGVSLTSFAAFAMALLWYIQINTVDHWVKYRNETTKLFGFLGEQLASTEDIRSNGSVRYVMKEFYNILKAMLPARIKAAIASNNMWAATILVFSTGNVIAFGISAYLWHRKLITIGTVYLIFSYTELLRRPIEQIRIELQDLQKSGASIERIQKLLDMSIDIKDGMDSLEAKDGISLDVRNVTFEYETGISVLKDISMSVEKGKVLGVIGRTGSGKTTLARLLVRLYDVKCGDIYLNGKSIKSIQFKDLRQKIGYVTQDVQIFNASVRDNLTLFSKSIADEEINNVLFDIGLKNWFDNLTDGLNTVLDTGGNGLSAGQCQLLAFARLFLRNPEMIILDEASSRVDPITQNMVEIALDKLLKGRTCIIIAHRLQTLQRANDILIVDNGKIIEYGSRETLLNDVNSRFYNLTQKGIKEVLV